MFPLTIMMVELVNSVSVDILGAWGYQSRQLGRFQKHRSQRKQSVSMERTYRTGTYAVV